MLFFWLEKIGGFFKRDLGEAHFAGGLLCNAEIVASARGRLARLALVRVVLDLVADNVLDAFKHERAQILDFILCMIRTDPHRDLVHFAARLELDAQASGHVFDRALLANQAQNGV